MASAEAKNIEAICRAIDEHNDRCNVGPAVAVRLCPFEWQRLGWDEVKGIPILADETMETGRFRIVCAGEAKDGQREKDVALTAPA